MNAAARYAAIVAVGLAVAGCAAAPVSKGHAPSLSPALAVQLEIAQCKAAVLAEIGPDTARSLSQPCA